MDNWEKIIRSCGQTDNKTLKLIDATVLTVNSHSSLFESATVRLITGQVINDLINASGNKIFVGQSVKVGYKTTPNAGWIHLVNGEINPIRLAGYDRENTPSYPADDNQVTVSEQMTLNVNSNLKMMYGEHPKILSVQGYACKMNNVNLDVADASNFGNHLEFDSYWRDSEDSEFVECRHTVDLYIMERASSTFYPVIKCSQYDKNTGTLLYSNAFSTWAVSNPSDIFLVPMISSISDLPDFNGQPTPYGYIQQNNLNLYVGCIESSKPTTIKYVEQYISGGYQAHIYLHGNNSFSVIPFDSLDEEYYNFAVTKAIEPRISGGG